MPVCAPAIPMNAGGIQVSMEKNKMTSDESLRPMPNDRVANKPVGMIEVALVAAVRFLRVSGKACPTVTGLRDK